MKARKRQYDVKQFHMKTSLDQQKLEEITAAAEAIPTKAPLHGQGEAAKILYKKGYSIRAISRFLADNGIAVSTTAITNYFQKENIL